MNPVAVFIAVLVLVAAVTHSVLAGAVIALAVLIAWWWRDVKRNPKVRCRACGGSGDNTSQFYVPGVTRRPAGACSKCGGKKGHPRMALRIVHPEARKRMLGEISRGRDRIGK